MTKIDIVSGFLGAGKTTLIQKLLREAFVGEQVVLIENEFGEIGIDGGFLKESGIEIREMNSGCICCSLVGDFGKSLKEVVATYHPNRILIEPSGVGKLSDVIKAVQGVQDEIGATLNSFTTVVDATKCKLYNKNFGEFFQNQIAYAGAIVLSRTDKATPEKIEESLSILRKENPHAPIVTTPIAALAGQVLLETMEGSKSLEAELLAELRAEGHTHEHEHEHAHEHEHEHGHEHGHAHEHAHSHGQDADDNHRHGDTSDHQHGADHGESHGEEHDHSHAHGHDHHADEIFDSWGVQTTRAYTKDEISQILEDLGADETYGLVLRAKGMVPQKFEQGSTSGSAQDGASDSAQDGAKENGTAGGSWIYFDMVPQEWELREGAPDYTGRICVIGSKLCADKLKARFGL